MSLTSIATVAPNLSAQLLAGELSTKGRTAAIEALARLPPADLAPFATTLACCLQDPGRSVRLAALQALGQLQPEVLAKHTAEVAEQLLDLDWSVRASVVLTLGRFLKERKVPACVEALAGRLLDESPAVRSIAAHALCDAFRGASPGVGVAAAALTHLSEAKLVEAATEIAKASPPELAVLVPLVGLPHGETLLHCAARAGEVRLAQALASGQRAALEGRVGVQNDDGDSPLHLAARHGHAEVCRVLVAAGAPLPPRNDAGQTAADLAELGSHKLAAAALEARALAHRGGSGDALRPALRDRRPVSSVKWHTIALPGLLGLAGALHSLLAITVGAAGDPQHTYVLEKSSPPPGALGSASHGTTVSHWSDVAPLVDGKPLHSLTASSIRNNTGRCDLSMRALWNVAIALGPYDPGTCNCHHGALAVYNASACEAEQVPTIPNWLLTLGARLLTRVGVDPAQSGASGRGSCGSLKGEAAPGKAADASAACCVDLMRLESCTLSPKLRPSPDRDDVCLGRMDRNPGLGPDDLAACEQRSPRQPLNGGESCKQAPDVGPGGPGCSNISACTVRI